MSLIKCIECGKEISDKSNMCPNCGCPTSESIKEKELSFFEFKCKNCNGTEYTKIENQGGVFLICDKCGFVDEIRPRQQMAENQDKLFYKCPVCKKEYKEGTLECNVCKYTSIIHPVQTFKQKNLPKCPICNSTNIEKLSFTKKAISIGGLGILSNKIGKTYQCKNCKSTW